MAKLSLAQSTAPRGRLNPAEERLITKWGTQDKNCKIQRGKTSPLSPADVTTDPWV